MPPDEEILLFFFFFFFFSFLLLFLTRSPPRSLPSDLHSATEQARMALACPDHATLELILQLQLDDLAALGDTWKNKTHNNKSENLARALYAEEVGQLLGDRRMARSMATAVQTDAMVVREHQVLERNEERDRLVACSLGGEEGVAEVERNVNTRTNKQQLNEESILKLAASYIGNLEGNETYKVNLVLRKSPKTKRHPIPRVASEGSSSKKAKNTIGGLTVRCQICLDDAPVSMTVDLIACGHLLCRECIRILFLKTIMNEGLYPPRCCEPIPLDIARPLISDDLALAFEMAEVEYKTHNRGPNNAKNTAKDLTMDCQICMDDTPTSMLISLVGCGHFLCRECIRVQFQKAAMNEELYPPQCCEPIPLDVARPFLSEELALAFEQAELEYKTPNRMYCARKCCSRFIPPVNVGNDLACCDECGMISCTICKTEYHDGDCPNDYETQDLLKVAANKGWKRCTFCEQVVELSHGCYHIT